MTGNGPKGGVSKEIDKAVDGGWKSGQEETHGGKIPIGGLGGWTEAVGRADRHPNERRGGGV